MPWTSLGQASDLDSTSRRASSLDPHDYHLSTTGPQAGPSKAGRDGSDSEQIPIVQEAAEEATTVTREETSEMNDGALEEMEGKTSKDSKKRKLKMRDEGDMLNRFGPPRQSVRARINLEFQTPPAPPKMLVSPKPKKAKKKHLDVSKTAKPSKASKKEKKRALEDKKGKRKDTTEAYAIVSSRRLKQEMEKSSGDIHPAMMLTDDDIKADEIIAYQPVSLEDMGYTRASIKPEGKTLEQRLQGKKRKDRKTIISIPKEDSDTDPPLVEIGSLEDPGPMPVKRGISSSTFIRVMRLVADLPLAERKAKKTKRLVPDHRPLVWAMVSPLSL